MRTQKLKVVSLILLIASLASSFASAAPMTSNSLTMPKSYSTGAQGSNDVPEGKSPTTGLDSTAEYRPMVVQISNHEEARPHLNMSEADIVYEAIYWGPAHTRYTLIFNDNHPEVVGSVRSARVYHCEIRQEWDAPFVFWGGQTDPGTNISDYFRANGVLKEMLLSAVGIPGAGGSKGFFRDSFSKTSNARANPHDAMVNLKYILENEWPKKGDGSPYVPKSHAYRFSTTPTKGQDTATKINIQYDQDGHYFPYYTFNATERVYERWYDGKEQMDGITNKRIVASNVIVQFIDLSFIMKSASRPVMSLVGSGVMDAFIDGRHIRGTWSRASVNDRTVFTDVNGEEITMLPGKTFIQILPTSADFSYFTADGTEKVMNIGSKVEETVFEDLGNPDEMDNMDMGDKK